MEEDIKILENYLEDLDVMIAYDKDEKDINIKQAIEHLIARNKELEEIVKTYNAIPSEYMNSSNKIVIADIQYFMNGILKRTLIPKSKVREKIEELTETRQYWTDEVQNILQELLED